VWQSFDIITASAESEQTNLREYGILRSGSPVPRDSFLRLKGSSGWNDALAVGSYEKPTGID
jgi:hypothetical protein